MIKRTNLNIKISGYSLHVVKVSPDDPISDRQLILLHDALGSVEQWRDFPDKLAHATGSSIIVYDRPLHGKSDSVSYKSVKEQFDAEKEILKELIDKLGINEPGLIGVSDGATISLTFACSYPCSFVVAMAPHVIMEDPIITGIDFWMERRDEFEKKLFNFHGEKTKFLIDQWYSLWKIAQQYGWDMTKNLIHIECLVLLIQDPEDPFGTLEQINIILEHVDTSDAILLPNAGHFPYVNYPEKVIELTKSLL